MIRFILVLLCSTLTSFAATPVVNWYSTGKGTNGHTISETGLLLNTHGVGLDVGYSGSAGDMVFTNRNEYRLHGPITCNNTNYYDTGTFGEGTMAVRNDAGTTRAIFDIPNQTIAVMSFFLTVGVDAGDTPSELFDYAQFITGAGGFAIVQLTTGSGLDLNIESSNGGTDHSASVRLVQLETYWVTFKANTVSGLCEMNVYTKDQGLLVGSVSVGMDTGSTLLQAQLGITSGHGNTSDTYTYFDDLCINWTDVTFPFLPEFERNGAGIPIQFAPTNVWAIAGVPGGITHRTDIYTNLAPGVTRTALAAAIANCTSNQVVQLTNGIYDLDVATIASAHGWTLRGMGKGLTILNITNDNGYNIGVGTSPPSAGGFSNGVNVVLGYYQGSTNIAVPQTNGYQPGAMAVIDQVNKDWIVGYGTGGGTTPTSNNDSAGKLQDGNRVQQHWVRVQSVSSTTITFWPPLPYALESERDPEISRFWANSGTTFQGPQWAGIEDLTIRGSGSNNRGLQIVGTYGCWMRGVEITNAPGFSLWWRRSAAGEIRESYIHDPAVFSVDHGYGMQLDPVSGFLVINNIIYNMQSLFLLQSGCSGNVIAYNAFLFGDYNNGGFDGDWLQHTINANHTPFSCYNLFEGNLTDKIQADYYYGPSGWNTLFRNRVFATGPEVDSATGGNRQAIEIDSNQKFYNVVGNQLGITNIPTSVILELPNVTRNFVESGSLPWGYSMVGEADYEDGFIYRFGYPYSGNNSTNTGTATNDITVKTNGVALLLHANWDACNMGVVNLASLGPTSLPDSLFLTSKPSFFESFQSWPPFGTNAPTTMTNDMAKTPAGFELLFGAQSDEPGGNGVTVSPVQGARGPMNRAR